VPWRAVFTASGADVSFFGFVTAQEIVDAIEDIYRHVFDAGFRYCLFDFTEPSRVDLTLADAHAIVDRTRRCALRHPLFHVAVVASTAYVFGMSRMWQAYVESSGLRTIVVRSRAEASDWLHEEGVMLPIRNIAQ
jgi:hypothetical protein